MASIECCTDLGVIQSTKKLHSVVELVLTYQVFQKLHFVAVATYDEVHVRVHLNYFWYYSDKQINSLAVLKAGNVDHIDCFLVALNIRTCGTWLEKVSVDSVLDCENPMRIDLCAKCYVVLARCTHGDTSIKVTVRPLYYLIQVDRCCISKIEQRVLSENCLDSKCRCCVDACTAEQTCTLMTMTYVDLFPHNYLSNNRDCIPKCEEGIITCNYWQLR